MSAPELITVLTTLGPKLTKTWKANGTVEDYDDALNHTVEQRPIGSVHDLLALLTELQHKPNTCLIRGKPVEGLDLSKQITRRLVNFEDKPSRLFMIDIDKFHPVLVDQPWREDQIELALTALMATLPSEFREVSYIWQASASFGHPSKGEQLRGHLWFWLDKPLGCAEAVEWVKAMLPSHCDCVVNRTVQANFTALPVLDRGVAYPVDESVQLRLVQGWAGDELTLPELDAEAVRRIQATRKGRKSRQLLVDPRLKPNVVGAFCTVYSPEDLVDLLPEMFAAGRCNDRITWLTGGGSPEGIGISDTGTHLFNTHNSSPIGDRAANLFDFIRVHQFGDLDEVFEQQRRKDREGLDTGDLSEDEYDELLGTRYEPPPSYTAMRDWALLQPGVQEELDTRKPKSEDERTEATKADKQKPTARKILKALTFDELEALPAASWLVKGVLPKQGLGCLYGPSGVGKSFAMLDMGLAVARGVPWQSRKVDQAAVIHVAAEGASGFKQRGKAYQMHHGVSLSGVPFYVCRTAPDLTGAPDVHAVCAMAEEVKASSGRAIGLVVLDTLNRVMGGKDENSAVDMGAVVNGMAAIAGQLGCLVMCVHHSGKDAAKGARGHSMLRAAMDVELSVDREGDELRVLKTTKMRDGDDAARFAFTLQPVEIGFDDEFEPIVAPVVVAANLTDVPKKTKGRPSIWGPLLHRVLGSQEEGERIKIEDLTSRALAMYVAEEGKPAPRGARDSIAKALDNEQAGGRLIITGDEVHVADLVEC